MSYASGGAGNRRAAVLVTVAGLHGLVLYGLLTGLGGSYIEKVLPGIVGRNIPIEPPPPPPEPEVAPKEQQPASDSFVTVPPRKPLVERDAPAFDVPIELPSFAPLPKAGPLIELPEVHQAEPAPRFTPKAARPRNNPALWVRTDDYPPSALRRGEEGTVRFELTIGTGGKVEDCRVTASSGSPALDAMTCKRVMSQARFEPATDGNGAAVSANWSGNVRWVIPDY